MEYFQGNYLLAVVAAVVSYVYYYYSQNQTHMDSVKYSIYTSLFVFFALYINIEKGLEETKRVIDDFIPGPVN